MRNPFRKQSVPTLTYAAQGIESQQLLAKMMSYIPDDTEEGRAERKNFETSIKAFEELWLSPKMVEAQQAR